MSAMNLAPYIIQELPEISELINQPLKCAQRIKYTCFDVSKTFIVFGATSGGIYVFNRRPCDFIQVIPSKDGAITRLAVSGDEKYIAFANGQGVVTVTNCEQIAGFRRQTLESKEHQGNEVSAMVWGSGLLFIGDDIGGVSVLQMSGFTTKSIFQSISQTIMNLDSRICQLDVRDYMLLISTLTRCYICDTSREQYRQIGQKLREGEFGACFFTTSAVDNGSLHSKGENFTTTKKYNIVDVDQTFSFNEKYTNTLIYCARPSSRLWEATVDGSVRVTHQYKQVLAKEAFNIISIDSYRNENVQLGLTNNEFEPQSCNFQKLFELKDAIFSYKKDALFLLNLRNVEHTIWCNAYKDILDCKVYNDIVYVWRQDGSLVNLKFMNIETYLVKCYFDHKYVLCAEMCALFHRHLLSEYCLMKNLYILAGLRDKLSTNEELLMKVGEVLEKFDKSKVDELTQPNSGVVVVCNTYLAQSVLNDESHDPIISRFSPTEAMKDLSSTVTDKITNSKKILDNLEGRVDILSREMESDRSLVIENDIIYKESSRKTIELNKDTVKYELCKLLYQHYRLSVTGRITDKTNLISTIENFSCDINEIYELMLSLEQYCESVNALEESKYAPNNLFLMYINESNKKTKLLEEIIINEQLYKYFVDSCILVNMKTQRLSNLACECGFPLPYTRTNKIPEYSELINEFIEIQWSGSTEEQCYEICRRMPYLWRKILYLRKNEDLMNILRLLLQIFDEKLLHGFLPQFTVITWERAVELYATLHGNRCLNCNKKFENIDVKETLSWDGLGALMIKSVGGRAAAGIIGRYAGLIGVGELTMKFYHSCLLVVLFEKYDGTIVGQLTDTLYSVFEFDDSRNAICNLLRTTVNGNLKNTSLPLIVAAKSPNWGLNPITIDNPTSDDDLSDDKKTLKIKNLTISEVLDNLTEINNCVTDCALCGLPLVNKVLIKDGGLWVFKCGHMYHGACLDLNLIKLCPSCVASG